MVTVFITGVSGFVGLHVAKAAKDAGYNVKGSVRSAAKYQEQLDAVVPGIALVELDLEKSTVQEMAAAMQGCEYCLHVASPVSLGEDMDVITPAVEGTKKMLRACKDAGVRRVVVTSSVAAIATGRLHQATLTADDWSILTGAISYAKGKTLAEKAAREFAAQNGLELCTVNPNLIVGPLLQDRSSESMDPILLMLSGKVPQVGRFAGNYCDVRDVAEVHIKALTVPEDGGRYLVSAGRLLATEVAGALQKEFPMYPVSTKEMSYCTARMYACFIPELAAIMGSWDHHQTLDSGPAEKLLGRKLRDPKESVLAAARSLHERGLVKV